MDNKTKLSHRQGGGYERRIGKCVYCGSTEQLSDERVIPEGLGGRDLLRAASCEPCRVETGKFEQHVLRNMLWAMRIRMKVRGKRRHPPTIPIYVQRQGQEAAFEQVSPEDVRVAAVLPSFSPPGLSLGARSGEVRGSARTLEEADEATQNPVRNQPRTISVIRAGAVPWQRRLARATSSANRASP